ncbi:hypothetical protein M885DRAFT_561875 [Pelagophyceae sp. CCMP2097]|nr:hypothetical protein M885DRAFT_561875 [Pelagophyceae sp. CCMP2097]
MTNHMVREAFHKGWENQWQVCEDLGIFEEPSGHSKRIGELKIGDIIVADAETFDPDNKIIWRLKDPSPGGWIYVQDAASASEPAPVRGPKTCVPVTEAIDKALKAGTTYWKVRGKKGTIVRGGKDMDSAQLEIIPLGSVCSIVESATLGDGKVRCRITEPIAGWISRDVADRWYKETK